MINCDSFQESLNIIKDCLASQNPYIKERMVLILDIISEIPIEIFDHEFIYNQLINSYHLFIRGQNYQYIITKNSSLEEHEFEYLIDVKNKKYTLFLLRYTNGYFLSNHMLNNRGFKIAKKDMPEFIEKLKTIKTMVNFI